MKQEGPYMVVLVADRDALWGEFSWAAAWFDTHDEARSCLERVRSSWVDAAQIGRETFDDSDLGDELPVEGLRRVELREAVMAWEVPDPAGVVIGKDTIIAVGEPGCYIYPGFLSTEGIYDMAEQVCEWFEEDWENLRPARCIWMLVTQSDEDDPADKHYREVHPLTPGAEPFTLIPVAGHWPAEPAWMQNLEEDS